MRAVTNAGPLIHLSWINRLDLLPDLFEIVIAPLAVQDEVLRAGPDIPGVTELRDAFGTGWLSVRPIADPSAVALLTLDLDLGESEAIVLMRETNADILLLDERRARNHAQRQGMSITGTIGILRMARDRGLIPAVSPLLETLRQYGFRVSAELVEQIQREEAPSTE